MMTVAKTLDERVARLKEKAKEVRFHIVDMIYEAQSGHPGGALSAADITTALYFDLLNVRPKEPRWPDRDRVVLSKGHACPVIYACLALRGYFGMEHLKTLRQFESILQGHPDMKVTPGLDMTTGSLGQGLSVAAGMALEGKMTGKDFTVYAIVGDGEINEGQIWEAAASAAKYHLDNLIAIVDKNKLQMDGFTWDVMPMEPIDKKFEAFNWDVLTMDGHNMQEIVTTLEKAKSMKGKPVCIIADTVKGKGVSYMENVRAWHGKTPNKEQYEQAIREIQEGIRCTLKEKKPKLQQEERFRNAWSNMERSIRSLRYSKPILDILPILTYLEISFLSVILTWALQKAIRWQPQPVWRLTGGQSWPVRMGYLFRCGPWKPSEHLFAIRI